MINFLTKKKGGSIHTVQKCVIEAHIAIEYHIAELMAHSVNLFIGIDGSGTGMQRNFLEIEFGGWHPSGPWSTLVTFAEFVKGGAAHELSAIESALNRFQNRQLKLGIPPLQISQLYYFDSIVYDNASTNTGCQNGLGKLLDQRREALWNESELKRLYPHFNLPTFITKGCSDHVVSLIPVHYRNFLREFAEKNTPTLVGKNHHRVDDVVKWLLSSCGGKDHRASFRSFCRTLHCQAISVFPIDESRFINTEIAMILVYCNFPLFFLYQLYRWNQLSAEKCKLFGALCDPDVVHLLRIRAIGAHIFLRPIMRIATGFQEGKPLAEFFQNMIMFVQTKNLEIRLFESNQQYKLNNHLLEGQGVQYYSFVQIVMNRYNLFTNHQNQLSELLSQYQINSLTISTFSESLQRLSLSSISNQIQRSAAHSQSLTGAAPSQFLTGQSSSVLTQFTSALFAESTSVICSPIQSSSRDLFFPSFPECSNLLNRRRIYGQQYLQCVLKMLTKHETPFISQMSLRSDNPFIRGTNRPGESNIGSAKNLVAINPNTRAEIMEAKLQLKNFSVEVIERAMERFEHLNLYSEAADNYKNFAKRTHYEDGHANSERERFQQQQQSEAEELQSIQKQLVKVMLVALGFMNQQERLLKAHLISFLMEKNISTNNKTVKLLLQDCQPFVLSYVHLILGSPRSEPLVQINSSVETLSQPLSLEF